MKPLRGTEQICRRTFLGRGAAGMGLLGLNCLLSPRLFAGTGLESRGVVNPLHHPAKAKRVIFLYQAGGPSHLETFDYKPKLRSMDGQGMPESFTKGQQIAQLQGKELKCFGPQYEFKTFGKSQQQICELFPHIGSVADDVCIVRPIMGSWILYGLGSESEDLPGFVVLLSSGRGGQNQPIAARQWSAGLLPSKFQGVKFNSAGDPVLYIHSPAGVSTKLQHDSIEAINALNNIENASVHDPEIATRVA